LPDKDLFVITDPPRSGMHPKTIEQLNKLRPKIIIYISCNIEQLGKDLPKFTSKGYELNFNLEVTPDAEAFLLFDPKVGDIIKGNGSANLRMEVTEAGDFNIYGDYIIDKGDYLFTLQNVINKKFVVVNWLWIQN
jgi:hypothetical protein